MADGEPEGDSHGMRLRTLVSWRADGEGGDRHEVIGAEPVKEPERQRVRREDHMAILPRLRLIRVVWPRSRLALDAHELPGLRPAGGSTPFDGDAHPGCRSWMPRNSIIRTPAGRASSAAEGRGPRAQ